MNYLRKFEKFLTLDNDLLTTQSLVNCHTKGVHSFVLNSQNGLLTRMFVTTPDHTLWKNHCGMMTKQWDDLSIAIHPHHVDIEIYPIYGLIWNVEFSIKKNKADDPNDCLLDAYKWKSEILTGSGKFQWCGEKVLQLCEHRLMLPSRKYSMKADELHTVYVSKTQIAAWIIQERIASKTYTGINYTNADLTTWTSDGLYEPASIDTIKEILNQVDIVL